MLPVSPLFLTEATVSIGLKMYSEWEHLFYNLDVHAVKQSPLSGPVFSFPIDSVTFIDDLFPLHFCTVGIQNTSSVYKWRTKSIDTR